MRCPVCNFENAETAKFCSNCGNRLPERRQTSSERKVVTVLFCDVKGSTALAEKLDPEEWTEVIDGAFRILTPPIQRYGGTVARLLGDAVLAFFGAPAAHEDDPERAVRAGLEMLQATGTYRERLVRERGAAFRDFDIRIGINTGLTVVGDVGSGQAVEYTGMGDAVNVAARLQSLAAPGAMLVSEHTMKLVPPLFEWEPAGDLDMKGREGKLQAFLVRGLASGATRTRPRGLVTPLVGRERELADLREALREVRRGGGRIVSMIGDAGLGKTRLIEEFRKDWEREPIPGQRWSEARGQSYEQSRSYGVFRQHLLALAGANEADPPEVIRARVTALLPEDKRADEQTLRTLEVFLAVQPASAAPGPEGQELRAEVHRLVRELTRGLALCQAVLVFDDLQWSDPASAELLMELFEIADESPALFICSFRPDRQAPSWRIKQKLETDFPHRSSELVLEPLSPDESAALLGHTLPGDGVPAGLRDRILDKAEGNPMFLEEIVRALLDDGTVVREGTGWRVTREVAEIALPGSLQAVLAARIDRLDTDARETLQAASVIGRTFMYRILASIREATATLDRQLLALQRLELVREQAREPEREYAFRHALTQEAAYGSILQRRRRELHVRVGEALERLFPDRMEELAAIIGHHFAEAGDPRAVGLLRTAGDRALRLYALPEAVVHYRRAVGLMRSAEEDPELLCAVYTKYGRALELQGQYAEAMALYQDLERIGQQREDLGIESTALSSQITVYSNPTPLIDPKRAAELSDRSIEIARRRGDLRLVARLLWNKGQAGMWRGEPDAGTEAGMESVAIAREIGDKEQLAYSLNGLGQSYRELARLDDAERALTDSVALFREVGNRAMEADGLSTLAFIHIGRGDLEKALRSGEEAYRISDEIDNAWGRGYGLFTPSYVHLIRGDLGKALDSFEECVRWAELGGFYAAVTGPGSDLGWLYVACGDTERGLAHLERVAELARKQFPRWQAWPLAQTARALLLIGEVARAREVLTQALRAAGEGEGGARRREVFMATYLGLASAEVALAEKRYEEAASMAAEATVQITDLKVRPDSLEFHLLEAEARIASGDLRGAEAAIARAQENADALGARAQLWRIHAARARVAEARGQTDAAKRHWQDAAAAVEEIASTLRGRGLDERFRARSDVRAVLFAADPARARVAPEASPPVASQP
jgi:class 3 adenylate cyclase/tetratricopeptide (TPR) repeat protein